MNSKWTSRLTVILVILLSMVARAGLQVQSYVDRNEMGLGDTVTLTVSVAVDDSTDVNVSEPRVPRLEGFNLMNSWTLSSTASKLMQGPNGMKFETVRKSDYNYLLSPTRSGNINIPAFEVVVEGKVYTTKPIVIKVSKQGSGSTQMPKGLPQGPGGFPPDDIEDEAEQMFNQLLQRRGLPQQLPQGRNQIPPGEDGQGQQQVPSGKVNPPKNPNESFYIQVDLDKTEVFEGEQITANWFIYNRGNILSLDRLKFPDLKGFWKEIIEEVPALNFTQEVINGVPWRRALLASHALFPIKAGTAVVDEYKIKANVQVPNSLFGNFGFGQAYTFTRSSDRIKINVKPLPTEGKPSDFAGAVGEFEMRASVEGQQFPVNQPFSLKVRFEGAGNAKLIELPPPQLPPGLELYDTKSESKFFKNGRSYKEFEVLVIPRQQGDFTLPKLTASMFDPRKKAYYSKFTDPIPVKIIAGTQDKGLLADRLKSNETPKIEKLKSLPDVIPFWESKSQLQNFKWPLLFIAYAGILIVLFLKARVEFGLGQKQKNIRNIMLARLKKIGPLIEQAQWRKASTEMTNIFYFVLGQAAGTNGANQELEKLLDQVPPSLRQELGPQIKKLMESFLALSFAPPEVVGSLNEKENVKKLIAEAQILLEKIVAFKEKNTTT